MRAEEIKLTTTMREALAHARRTASGWTCHPLLKMKEAGRALREAGLPHNRYIEEQTFHGR
jgi:hypothetical protein